MTLTDPNGVITSPGFPNDYPANSNICMAHPTSQRKIH